MYLVTSDDRLIRREPVRVLDVRVSGSGLGFAAPAIAVAASAGPPGWIVAGAMAVGSLIPAIIGLFHRGHKDDAIDAAEHMIIKQSFAPMLSEVLGRQVRGIWNENSKGVCPKEGCGHDIEAASYEAQLMEERGEWRISAQHTADLIAYGDQVMAEACSTFAAQGFPCRKWVSGSGGGTYAFGIWQVLRQVMTAGLAVAQRLETEASAPQNTQTNANNAANGAGSGSGAAVPGIVPAGVVEWFSKDTVIGSQPIPNAMLAAAAGLAIAWAVSK